MYSKFDLQIYCVINLNFLIPIPIPITSLTINLFVLLTVNRLIFITIALKFTPPIVIKSNFLNLLLLIIASIALIVNHLVIIFLFKINFYSHLLNFLLNYLRPIISLINPIHFCWALTIFRCWNRVFKNYFKLFNLVINLHLLRFSCFKGFILQFMNFLLVKIIDFYLIIQFLITHLICCFHLIHLLKLVPLFVD